jgi:hypothetical protein
LHFSRRMATVWAMEEPMKARKLPKADSISDLEQFWDTHDLTDFEDELEEVTTPVFESDGSSASP